jgi:hypothetical protein
MDSGLPFVEPLQDYSDVQIQRVGSGLEAATPVVEAQQAQPLTQPESQPIERIVAADTVPDAAAQLAAPALTPVYVPIYVPEYIPEYVPQTIVVQSPPQVIVQQEFIPFPVYEPILILDPHRNFFDCGIEITDHHRREVAVLVNRPERGPVRVPGVSGHMPPPLVVTRNDFGGAAGSPSVLPVKNLPAKVAATPTLTVKRTDAPRNVVITPAAEADAQPVLKTLPPPPAAVKTPPAPAPSKPIVTRTPPKVDSPAIAVPPNTAKPPLVAAPEPPQLPVVVRTETPPRVIAPAAKKTDAAGIVEKVDKPKVVIKPLPTPEPKVEPVIKPSPVVKVDPPVKAAPVVKADSDPAPVKTIVVPAPKTDSSRITFRTETPPDPQPVKVIPPSRPAPMVQMPPVIRVADPVVRTPAPVVTETPVVRTIAPPKTPDNDKASGGSPIVIPTRPSGRAGR